MINTQIRREIKKATREAKTDDLWKEEVRRLVSLYGEDAIYYVDGSRFLSNEETAAGCNPWHRWDSTGYGVAVKATEYDPETELWDEYVSKMIWLG